MKARDERRVSTLRMVNAAIKNADIEARGQGKGPLGDDELLSLLQKMIKQRQESVELYDKGGRPELAAQERDEIAIISALPAAADVGRRGQGARSPRPIAGDRRRHHEGHGPRDGGAEGALRRQDGFRQGGRAGEGAARRVDAPARLRACGLRCGAPDADHRAPRDRGRCRAAVLAQRRGPGHPCGARCRDGSSRPGRTRFAAAAAALLGNPYNLVLVAEVGAEPVGYVYASVTRHPETPWRYAYEWSTSIRSACAPRIAASASAPRSSRAVRADAASRNVALLALDVWSFNADARAFFQRQGFAPYNERMVSTTTGSGR